MADFTPLGVEAVIKGLEGFSRGLEQMGNGIDSVGKKANGLGGQFVAAGAGVVKLGALAASAAVGGIAALTGGIVALTLKTAASADELVELSDKTGISVERLQELKYIGEQTGTSVESVTGAMARLVRSMASADKSTSPTAEAFKKLGVNVKDAKGNLRDSQSVFADTIDALGKIENPAERDALAMALFGRSAQELNPLIKAGSKNLTLMAEEARKLGIVLSDDAIKAAADFNDKLAAVKMGLAGAALRIGSVFIPIFSKLLDKYVLPAIPVFVELATSIGQVIDWLSKGDTFKNAFAPLGNFLNTILPGASGVLANVGGAIDFVIGKFKEFIDVVGPLVNQVLGFMVQNWEAIKGALIGIGVVLAGAGIAALIAGIVTALGAILSPIGLIVAAAALLGVAWSTNWMGIRDTLTQVWEQTIRPALENLQAWLQVNIPLAIDWLKTKWEELKVKAGEVWSWIQENVIPKIIEIRDWLQVNIPLAIDWLKTKWEELKVKMGEIWTWVQENVFPVLDNLRIWIEQNLPAAVNTFKSKLDELITKFTNLVDYIKDPVLPTFLNVKTRMDADMYGAAQKLADVIKNPLLPAFKEIHDFLKDHVLPLFISIEGLLGAIHLVIFKLATLIGSALLLSFQNVYIFLSTKLNEIIKIFGDKTKEAGDKVETARSFIDKLHTALGNIGTVIDGLKTKIDDLAKWLIDLAKKIPSVFMPGSPTPFEMGLRGIALAMEVVATGAASLSRTLKGFPVAMLEDVFKLGGGFGSFGGAVAGRFTKQTLDPLKARIDAVVAQQKALQDVMDEQGFGDIGQLSEMNRLEAQRVALVAEYAKQQQKILDMQQQEADLSFLKAQLDFLKLLKEEKLDLGSILGGLKLGLEADLPSLLAAMTGAIQEMVRKAQLELGARSPSKVFARLGQNIMQGLAGGMQSMLGAPLGAMQASLAALAAAPRVAAPSVMRTVNVQFGDTHINDGMDQAMFEASVQRAIVGAF